MGTSPPGNDEHAAGPAGGWDRYWQADRGEALAGSSTHPELERFWAGFFAEASGVSTDPRLVDLASGSGAVVQSAIAGLGDASITCIDLSAAAIRRLESRYPGVRGVVADVRAIPLAPGSCDLLTSQFGVEYAGSDALYDALALLAPGGRLGCLLHCRDGEIHRHCGANLQAVTELQESGFIRQGIDLFRAASALRRGGDPAAVDAAAKRLAPAVRAVEAIIRRHGKHVAEGALLRLYRDVRTVHQRLAHYEPDEIVHWLESMQREFAAYAARLSAMQAAALDPSAFDALCERLRDRGIRIRRRDTVGPAVGAPLAWALVAERD